MAEKFRNVKGTRDFYPEDMVLHRWLLDMWRTVSIRNGFVEYDGPTFEYLDLYKAKSGEGIVSELFHFEDRGGRQLALRPEMTPTLARMAAARAHALPRPVKWFCVPNFFRAERPQRGRLREFWQWNIDIITEDGPEVHLADAECIYTAIDLLRSVGLSPEQAEVRINSRALVAQVLDRLAIEGAQLDAVFAVLDKRDKLPPEVFKAEVEKVASGPEQVRTLLDLGRAEGPEGLEVLADLLGGVQPADSPMGALHAVIDQLASMGVGDYLRFDMGVVRGLAYYTGIVFEAFSKGTLRRAILGGGRYGQLLKALGGPPLTGVGFGMGDVVLLDQLEEHGVTPQLAPELDVFVARAGDVGAARLMAIVGTIRGVGRSCGFAYRAQALKKQIQQASQQGARYVIIAGQAAQVGVKDMATGQQVDVAWDGLRQRIESSGADDQPFTSLFAN